MFDTQNVTLSRNDRRRGLVLPSEPSINLSELFGLLTGDGYLNYYPSQCKYLLEITGDMRLDYDYLIHHVASLIYSEFRIKPTFQYRPGQNTIVLRIISRGLVEYLSSIGFPKGKKEQISPPNWILQNTPFF
jgi:hypothetical protein